MDTWLGRDADPLTLNKYLYVNSDPINYVDLSGNELSAAQQLATLGIGSILFLAAVHNTTQFLAPSSGDGNYNTSIASGTIFLDMIQLMSAVRNAQAEVEVQDTVLYNTKHTKQVIEGLLAVAEVHADKIGASGGNPNDPNDHWRKEVKAFLEKAKKLAKKRLKGSTRDFFLQKIDAIAARAGVTLL